MYFSNSVDFKGLYSVSRKSWRKDFPVTKNQDDDVNDVATNTVRSREIYWANAFINGVIQCHEINRYTSFRFYTRIPQRKTSFSLFHPLLAVTLWYPAQLRGSSDINYNAPLRTERWTVWLLWLQVPSAHFYVVLIYFFYYYYYYYYYYSLSPLCRVFT
jgi:hypothetical protein